VAGAIDLKRTYLHFTQAHGIDPYDAGAQFWDDLMSERLRLTGRLVGCTRMSRGRLDHWECHPAGDEFLLLLSGAVTIVLEHADGQRRVHLQPGEAFVVPQGVWHTFEIAAEGDLIFATAGDGTEHRPAGT
jgi:mannose-6-phosphate isomerase-like protein (cupin superfamily)